MWWLVANAWALDLSYDEALKRALEKNPALLQAGYDREIADGTLMEIRGIFDPTLAAGLDYSRGTLIDDTGTSYTGRGVAYSAGIYQFFPTGTTAALTWGLSKSNAVTRLPGDATPVLETDPLFDSDFTLSLSQPLLQGVWTHYTLASVRAARRFRDIEEAALHAQRQQTLADVSLAYWDYYYLRKVAEITRTAIEVAQEEQRVVRARVDAGDLAPVERSRVDALVAQAQSALLTADGDAEAAGDALLLVIGELPGTSVQLTTEPAEPPEVALDADATVQDAMASNPTIQALRINEEAEAEALRDSRHARLPELTGNFSYGLHAIDENSAGDATRSLLDGNRSGWTIGADLSIPLLNRADRGDILSQQAVAGKARIQREEAERTIDQQLRAQVRTLTSSRTSVALAQANLQFAEETLAAQRALQNAGRAIQKDVLEAIRDVNDAKVALAKARVDAALALVELNRLKGSL